MVSDARLLTTSFETHANAFTQPTERAHSPRMTQRIGIHSMRQMKHRSKPWRQSFNLLIY